MIGRKNIDVGTGHNLAVEQKKQAKEAAELRLEKEAQELQERQRRLQEAEEIRRKSQAAKFANLVTNLVVGSSDQDEENESSEVDAVIETKEKNKPKELSSKKLTNYEKTSKRKRLRDIRKRKMLTAPAQTAVTLSPLCWLCFEIAKDLLWAYALIGLPLKVVPWALKQGDCNVTEAKTEAEKKRLFELDHVEEVCEYPPLIIVSACAQGVVALAAAWAGHKLAKLASRGEKGPAWAAAAAAAACSLGATAIGLASGLTPVLYEVVWLTACAMQLTGMCLIPKKQNVLKSALLETRMADPINWSVKNVSDTPFSMATPGSRRSSRRASRRSISSGNSSSRRSSSVKSGTLQPHTNPEWMQQRRKSTNSGGLPVLWRSRQSRGPGDSDVESEPSSRRNSRSGSFQPSTRGYSRSGSVLGYMIGNKQARGTRPLVAGLDEATPDEQKLHVVQWDTHIQNIAKGAPKTVVEMPKTSMYTRKDSNITLNQNPSLTFLPTPSRKQKHDQITHVYSPNKLVKNSDSSDILNDSSNLDSSNTSSSTSDVLTSAVDSPNLRKSQVPSTSNSFHKNLTYSISISPKAFKQHQGQYFDANNERKEEGQRFIKEKHHTKRHWHWSFYS